ncbi:MAG: FliI/YscN family ATPase [Spirochaetaceae bacterium]|nr:FliI/YscN family ATPase [Spirochaetaceae bacterium]
MENIFSKYIETVENSETIKYCGRVFRVQGSLIESRGPRSVVGELCWFNDKSGRKITAEVIGINNASVQLMAYTDCAGIEAGTLVTASGSCLEIPVSRSLLGRVIGPLGTPVDGKGGISATERRAALSSPPPALSRPVIKKRVVTGIRSVDALTPVGMGQRMGVFAGSGVGKSTFQGMIARNTNADVNVIALIGERGREVNDFLENNLGEEGLKKSVVVVSTGDQSAIAQLRGAYTATAVAEYFRDQGLNVMLLFDSVTRFAYAQREIGLAGGEPPAQRGYPPSVFALMPKLMERAGAAASGSITAFYTVLVDGGDMDEPVSDKARSILDGHIVLSRDLAARGHYPPVDVLSSISRLASSVSSAADQKAAEAARGFLADYAGAADIINAGAYKAGSSPAIDAAIAKKPQIDAFLKQPVYENSPLEETLQKLREITGIKEPEK